MDNRLFGIKHPRHNIISISTKKPKPKKASITTANDASINMTSYATILLREYSGLVSMLAFLDEKTLQLYNTEINHTIDKLIHWFDKTTTTQTFEVYWDMRRLRSKLRNHVERLNAAKNQLEKTAKYA